VATADAPRVLYVDSSAIVKLVVRESESDALRDFLHSAQLVTSEVALTEVPRAAHLRTGAVAALDHAETVLRRFDLVELDEELHRAAARRAPRDLSTLDAIHLVSALRLGASLDAVVAYDRRFIEAARDARLRVDVPGA
jgi:predicted nucleic acid-binding protein